ncbi:Os08g0179800 [Oryza sativa Japonica Group]|uniref:Os08g0179800 protein n=2 Tax=Oryza sativa subsp. japonica TaxID=39947 RepID=Q6Z9U9_ORYSJ|nr:hypothetical protein [Oryza sativa Japonica Group]BAT04102.1 Os08g0179800 [Oryza sativa Japonica Group]
MLLFKPPLANEEHNCRWKMEQWRCDVAEDPLQSTSCRRGAFRSSHRATSVRNELPRALHVDFAGDHRATASPPSRTHSGRRQGRDEGGDGDHSEPAPLTTED